MLIKIPKTLPITIIAKEKWYIMFSSFSSPTAVSHQVLLFFLQRDYSAGISFPYFVTIPALALQIPSNPIASASHLDSWPLVSPSSNAVYPQPEVNFL